jgi:hypothetical protein
VTTTVLVAGGGLVREGGVDALREVVLRTDIGAFNTWTAKGLFPWDAPAHLGTIGLQERDVELAELASFDDVVLVGVDLDELSREQLQGVRWRDVSPGDLLSLDLPVLPAPLGRPALYGALAAVCQPMYVDDTTPLNPARAAADLSRWRHPENLPTVVCGDADRAGFWLGRTFPTPRLGSIVLPAAPVPGFALTQALLASRTRRFGVAVVATLDDASAAIVERARALGVSMIVEVWSDDGPLRTAQERLDALDTAAASGGVTVVETAVRYAAVEELIEVAGRPIW